jgi:hypothetical protein
MVWLLNDKNGFSLQRFVKLASKKRRAGKLMARHPQQGNDYFYLVRVLVQSRVMT